MTKEIEQAVQRAAFEDAQEAAALEELEAELMKHWHVLEMVGLAVVRARESGEDQVVPGLLIHGVPLHVKADEVAAAHPPDDGPEPKKPEPQIILPH